MTKEEIKILELLGVNFPTHLPMPSQGRNYGILNGFFISKYNYYWIVNGKFPIEHAKRIYKDYKSLKIRVEGGCEDWKPEAYKTSDRYKKWSKIYFSKARKKEKDFDKIETIMNLKLEEMYLNHPEEFYIETYHIDTFEGLEIMIKYIKDNNLITMWS